jgi:hypothetical protein
MQMMGKQWIGAGIGFLIAVLVAGGMWYAGTKKFASVAPVAESPASEATTTPPATTTASSLPKPIPKFPINPSDTIVSWSFKGAYAGNDALIAKANADIARLTGILGKGQYDDYDVYIGIGNSYDLMGDGAAAYAEYNHAVSIHPNKGLAYTSIAYLMDELGAYHTAADAYAKAVAVEPLVVQYRTAQLDFLKWRFPEEAAKLQAAQ